ncbi:MAG: hypothetical protein ABSA75_02450 [Candidatus Bathyarchaeia archaeon]|jgi:hypothetical protein
MKEKVAVATVEGKAYFLIVNGLKEQNISFISLVPGELVPAEVKVIITTEKEKNSVKHEKTLIFTSENELDNLVNAVKRILLGKEAYEKIVIGIDPGEAIGVAAIADGKVIAESNCFSIKEAINSITKIIKNVNFSFTNVSVKIGNGVPVYKELLEALDDAISPEVMLEVVGEAGTNRPLKEKKRSRGIRHISSAIRIAGRDGYIFQRRKIIATNS